MTRYFMQALKCNFKFKGAYDGIYDSCYLNEAAREGLRAKKVKFSGAEIPQDFLCCSILLQVV